MEQQRESGDYDEVGKLAEMGGDESPHSNGGVWR